MTHHFMFTLKEIDSKHTNTHAILNNLRNTKRKN